MTSFNLIATCGKDMEFDAAFELRRLLSMLGDTEAEIWESEIKGLILGSTRQDPNSIVVGLRKLLKEKPWEFRLLRRVIPIEIVVKTDLNEISMACKQLSREIDAHKTFRITLEKRHSKITSKDIIDAAAEHVSSPVDLKNPDKVILIEVVGNLTGISLLEAEKSILNINKELLKF